MPARPINGRAVAKRITEETRAELAALPDVTPGLAIVLVGDDPASHLYVRLKAKACADVGIAFRKELLPADATLANVLKTVMALNEDPSVDAILVQLPLPDGLDEDAVIRTIDPLKDVDGFHPKTVAAMRAGKPTVIPGLAAGIMALIHETKRDIDDHHLLVVANSETFAEPIMHLAKQRGMFTAYAHPDSADLKESIAGCSVLVVAVGRPGFITGDMVKPDAVLIDVGTTKVGDKVVGDVAPSAWDVAGHVTPVPGGVGPVTVAMLLRNAVRLARLHREK